MIAKKSDRCISGHPVAESSKALGALTCFGLPGQHALGMFDGARVSDLRYVRHAERHGLSSGEQGTMPVATAATPAHRPESRREDADDDQ